MSRVAWTLVDLLSRLLDGEEREAVLGDLRETGQSAWRGFEDVSGLILRRQAALWRDPRPWLAGFVVALPCSYLLTHVSISVTCTYERLVNHRVYACWHTGHEGFPLLLCHILLLAAWSWSGGYIVGSVSRRTVWMSAALSVIPSMFCLCWDGHVFPARPCVFLFVLPAIFGVYRGLQSAAIPLRAAMLLALTVTVLMISAWTNQALWALNWALVLPAWYLVATAWRSRRGSGVMPMRRASVPQG